MSSAVFQEFAPRYARQGLRTIPVGLSKTPLIRNWQKVGTGTYKKLQERFSDANVGVLDGTFGGITRIDIDSRDLIDECVDRFGETPIVIGTPSGGVHLCYRANGEGRHLRLDGKPIDVLGSGGFGLMPPSCTDKGEYKFLEGSIEQLSGDLPILDGLELPSGMPLHLAKVGEGDGRNQMMFKSLLGYATYCASFDDLFFTAEQMNSQFSSPLPEKEVSKTVSSVWRYKEEDRLLNKGCESTALVPRSIFERLEPAELHLLVGLTLEHGAKKGAPFVLAQQAAAKYGLSVTTFRKYQHGLVEKGCLDILQEGKQGKRAKTIVRLIK